MSWHGCGMAFWSVSCFYLLTNSRREVLEAPPAMSAEYRNTNAPVDADIDIPACEAWLLQAESALSQWMLDKELDQVERKHYELLGEISQYRSELTPLRSSAGPLLTHTIEHRTSTNSMNERNSDTVSLKDLQAYLNKGRKPRPQTRSRRDPLSTPTWLIALRS
jgi:hypothetical protein